MFFVGLALFGLMFAVILAVEGYLAIQLWSTRQADKKAVADRVELP
jgi:hypothetical protein